MSTLGQRIRELRTKSNLTQSDLAFDIGCKSTTISNYEGDRREPSLTELSKIAKAFSDEIGDHEFYLVTGVHLQDHINSGAYCSQYIKKSDAIEQSGELIRSLINLKEIRLAGNTKASDVISQFSKLLSAFSAPCLKKLKAS
jgi:transcriptional regulator with XRE-family HTH domain